MVYIRKSHDFRDVWMFDDVWGLFNLVQSCSILFNLVQSCSQVIVWGLCTRGICASLPTSANFLLISFIPSFKAAPLCWVDGSFWTRRPDHFWTYRRTKTPARATLYRNLQENAAPQNLGPHFVRACAVEMHLNISQEPLHMEMYRKNAGAQNEHPDRPLHLP